MNIQLLASATADVVSAYVSKNQLSPDGLLELIRTTATSLRGLENGASPNVLADAAPANLEPAVPIRRSITPDFLICLEDGKKFKSLKRHLRTKYNMSPEQYRAKWGLPADYPMAAPNYAKVRSDLAKQFGLGSKAGAATEAEPAPEPAAVEDEVPSALADEGIPGSVLEADEVVTDATGAVIEEGPKADAEPTGQPTVEFQDDDDAHVGGEAVDPNSGPGALPQGFTDVSETFIREGDKVTGIVCLIDNKTARDLGRHARRNHKVSADQYRAMYGLPADYPMTVDAVEAFLAKQAS